METRPPGLRLIVTYKLTKAVLQTAAAALLLYGATHGLNAKLAAFAERLREHAVHAWSALFAKALLRFSHSRFSLSWTAAALLFDAALSALEGWALRRGHTWAEWLVVGATGVFVPFEGWALVRHPRAGRIVLLLLNLAIVAYLLVNLRSRRRAPEPAARDPQVKSRLR